MIINRHHKLPAFTLVEVLIVITLSCFFVIMVYASVHFFLLFYVRDKVVQQATGTLWTLEGNLLHEIESSKILHCSQTDSLLVCIMPTGDTIRYNFHHRFILRSQNPRLDTFKVSCAELRFNYEGLPVESGIADRIDMKIGYKQSLQELQLDKTYTSDVLFKLADSLNLIAP
jgi:hypothetical protein